MTLATPAPEHAMQMPAALSSVEVSVPCRGRGGGALGLPGLLVVPGTATGVVVFAHGGGSGRTSPRNDFVAESLHAGHLATLRFDLLAAEEAMDRTLVFDIELLAGRVLSACRFVLGREGVRHLPLGLFGASTGAAAAIVAASREPRVRSVVSRGGRPDLAGPALSAVHVPTLLIVGGHDEDVLELNRRALTHLGGECRLAVVRGAGHLFEEPGALEEVARLAADWFRRSLRPRAD